MTVKDSMDNKIILLFRTMGSCKSFSVPDVMNKSLSFFIGFLDRRIGFIIRTSRKCD
jgi:hypothetical protein